MATQVRGIIQFLPTAREVPIRGGKVVKYYSMKVNDVYYSTGQKSPPSVGSLVEFEAEQNSRGFWDVTKAGVRVVQGEEPTQQVATRAVSAAATSPMSKDDYWRRKEERDLTKEAAFESKDRRIELQSCRNSAIEFVTLLLTPIQTPDGVVNLVKLPAQAKRVEFVEQMLAKYTEQFVSENNKKNEEVANNAEVEADSVERPVGTPDDANWE